MKMSSVQFSSVPQSCPTSLWPQGLLQASLSITNSWSLLRLMSIELVMPSNHLILCPTSSKILLPSCVMNIDNCCQVILKSLKLMNISVHEIIKIVSFPSKCVVEISDRRFDLNGHDFYVLSLQAVGFHVYFYWLLNSVY